jgi:nucleotidyltransferase/DNA polymerase involved in DNA repair
MSQGKCDLLEIPGVGPRIADYLESVGVHHVADLKDADPEEVYRRLCEKHARTFDRCLLYVFRCAAYYASTPRPQPHLLKWWAWM